MTTENNTEFVTPPVQEGPTLEQLQKQVADLTSIKSTAFTERDNWKTKAHEASAKLEQVTRDFEELKSKPSDVDALNGKLSKVQSKLVDAAIMTQLQKSGATNPSTAAKLLDRSLVTFDDELNIVEDAITKQIEALKESDPILFQPVSQKQVLPPVARPTTPEGGNTLQEQLKAAKSHKEIQQILATNGIKTIS